MDKRSSFDVACVKGLFKRIKGPSSVRSTFDTRQPAMRRAWASMTKAV